MGLGDTFAYYGYTSDDGNTYSQKMSTAVAGAGGFGAEVDPNDTPPWPYHEKHLRHVWGVDSDGHRTRLPVSSPGNALYVSGGAFNLHGRSYTVQGQIGEKRAKNSMS